jgi:hypothetical protein
VIEVIPAGNDVNLPGLATTETLTRHVNLNYFSEAVSWEGEARLADADSWRINGSTRKLCQGRSPLRGRQAVFRGYHGQKGNRLNSCVVPVSVSI